MSLYCSLVKRFFNFLICLVCLKSFTNELLQSYRSVALIETNLLYRVIEREPTVTVELEWSRPTQTYGELQGYRLRYGVKDQILKEVSLKGIIFKHIIFF